MKTDKVIRVLPAVIALGGVTYLASTNPTARFLTEVAVAISYGAVVALVALAAVDYRSSARSYAKR